MTTAEATKTIARSGESLDVVSPTLCVVSTASALAPGGLSAWIRTLTGELRERWDVSSVARFAADAPDQVDYASRELARWMLADDVPLSIIHPRAGTGPILGQLKRMLARPALWDAAIRSFSAAYSPALASAIPTRTNVVHYVGCGWELLGFPVLDIARQRGAAFTVWPALHPGSWGDSELDARLYRSADAVIALSQYERRHLVRLGVDREKIHVTGLAAGDLPAGDGNRFRQRHGLGDRPLVLFIGRRQRYKGYHALCHAMQMVRERHPDVCLIAAGPSTEPPFPQLPDGTLLDLGTCDEQEKADALAGCDLLCMPSDGESFGLAYLEAWRAGKPVVGGPAPAVRELIVDGVDGLHVDQSPESIASAVALLLSNDELRRSMGAAGARKARRFTPSTVAARHDRIFDGVRSARREASSGGAR